MLTLNKGSYKDAGEPLFLVCFVFSILLEWSSLHISTMQSILLTDLVTQIERKKYHHLKGLNR
jgi:hypothetical protein